MSNRLFEDIIIASSVGAMGFDVNDRFTGSFGVSSI
jgi:hypothetical protein